MFLIWTTEIIYIYVLIYSPFKKPSSDTKNQFLTLTHIDGVSKGYNALILGGYQYLIFKPLTAQNEDDSS